MNLLKNGSLWKDSDGNPIHAHGGFIIYYDNFYYWYGEDRRDDYYVNCYRSKDLANWEFRNHVLTTDSKTKHTRVRTQLSLVNGDHTKVNIERPKVLFNPLTKKFILWAHFENGKDYSEAAAAIASCDTPDGNFVYHGHMNPFGYMSRDCTLFQDDDGTAYFISAARDNADLHIYRLSSDYMNVDKLVRKLWQGEYREAPAVFKRKERYYMVSSYCTGWAPNQGKYATSDSMDGNWTLLENFGDETTYDTQPAFVLKLNEEEILYYSDRWDAENYINSSYVLLPLQFEEEKLILKYYDQYEIDDDKNIQFK
ncbi:family 43 glycosylhydrolase [Gracilibacillus salitolerans]|uniref:Family 43 glycosylhydrolase n=1 Tax=Gracilibacillus salitolerans TaxID=2663022 RepID=A0A5Q2TH58_9BACI|nr:family 43 glycosylhydrolase [Gracilibacillus salitolerans]QGH33995.1 family 43 glycosylhydrolase [Gracilibacillus salitolerans]